MAATMLDAAGTSIAGIPARSLAPLTAGADEQRDAAVSMIRLRATFDHESGDVVEFFDLVGDPDESDNLAPTAPTAPTAEVDRLRDLAQAELAVDRIPSASENSTSGREDQA